MSATRALYITDQRFGWGADGRSDRAGARASRDISILRLLITWRRALLNKLPRLGVASVRSRRARLGGDTAETLQHHGLLLSYGVHAIRFILNWILCWTFSTVAVLYPEHGRAQRHPVSTVTGGQMLLEPEVVPSVRATPYRDAHVSHSGGTHLRSRGAEDDTVLTLGL